MNRRTRVDGKVRFAAGRARPSGAEALFDALWTAQERATMVDETELDLPARPLDSHLDGAGFVYALAGRAD